MLFYIKIGLGFFGVMVYFINISRKYVSWVWILGYVVMLKIKNIFKSWIKLFLKV